MPSEDHGQGVRGVGGPSAAGNGRSAEAKGAPPGGPDRPDEDGRQDIAGLSAVPDGSVIVRPSARSSRDLSVLDPLAEPDQEREPYRPATLKELRASKKNGPTSETVKEIRRAARQRRIRRRRRVVGSVVALVILLLAVVGWYELQAHPGGSGGSPVLIHVTKGESSATLTDDIISKGVVTSGVAYHFYLFFHSLPSAQSGDYIFHQGESFGAVNQILTGGPNVTTLYVPPGFTLRELATRVGTLAGYSAQGFNNVVQSGQVRSPWETPGVNNLEGLVSPGVYPVLPGESDKKILEAMVQRFNQTAASLGVTPQDAQHLGVSPNQLITVASIVQKEGYITSNMPKVARVIYNRLAASMPLQMDSTVLYSEGRDGGPVTQQDEQIQSPYNTYLNTGLPPTPVSFPSRAALQAAGHPPQGSWLYFVVIDKAGNEAFTSSYQQQLANEALAQSRGLS